MPGLDERFWAKVDRRSTNECWEWTAARNAAGYGQFRVTGQHSPVNAHRVAYEMSSGPIPAGHHIDHLCRNRGCVNPAHLEPVTQRTNTLRGAGATAINARKTHCKRGHEFTPENTYEHPLGRNCRTCLRSNARELRARSHAGMPANHPSETP